MRTVLFPCWLKVSKKVELNIVAESKISSFMLNGVDRKILLLGYNGKGRIL